MRRRLPAGLWPILLVLLAASPAAARAPAEYRPDVRAARDYAEGRAGVIAFAVRTERSAPGRRRLVGRLLDRTFSSASVVKAMMLVAYLREPGVGSRGLRLDERRLLRPMIVQSDNDAASAVFNRIGSDALLRLARRVGMGRFTTSPFWGFSQITARDQTRFFLGIDRLIPRRHRHWAMTLLRDIVPSQRWGLARAVPRGWTLYFKGGWGSGSGAVDHQIGLLRRGSQRVAVAVLTIGNPDHEYGKATEESIAHRLLRGLAAAATAGPPAPAMVAGPPTPAR